MNKTNCVYKITTDFNDKVYIGVAKNFDSRMYQHKNAHDWDKSYIDKSIKEHGWEHFQVEIIDNYTTEEERKTKEQYYIKLYHAHRSENGYNLTWGGDDCCFPDVSGEKNPRAYFTEEDVRNIRQRRMNGERLADVFKDYADKSLGDRRAGFSKIWLHESWPNVCPEFKGEYPEVNSAHYATIKYNQLSKEDIELLIKYFKWHGPIPRYNEPYKAFKNKIDWETFQNQCKEIINTLYGGPSTRRYRQKNGTINVMIMKNRQELGEEPLLEQKGEK